MQAQCKTTDRHDYSDAHIIELKGFKFKHMQTTNRNICTSSSNKAATCISQIKQHYRHRRKDMQCTELTCFEAYN